MDSRGTLPGAGIRVRLQHHDRQWNRSSFAEDHAGVPGIGLV